MNKPPASYRGGRFAINDLCWAKRELGRIEP